MAKGFRELDKIITLKPEPETTPSLAKLIQKGNAAQTVSQYYFTPSLRAHFKRIFDCVVNAKGQGFWVQAEYGAGKTHFQGTLIDLLVWKDDDVWHSLTDEELKHDYHDALEKVKLFPVAFSLRGMGESDGQDSLMRVFEDQIRASIKAFAPQLDAQIKLTSVELADEWYQIFAELRRLNFQTHVNRWLDFGNMTGRNQDAVEKTVAGMLKLVHPDRTPESIGPDEIAPLAHFAVEMRKRVTDQLSKMLPFEFSNVDYQYRLVEESRSLDPSE
jgi:hypothetical protein